MRRLSVWFVGVLVVVGLAASALSAVAAGQGKMKAKGQEVTISGKLSCTSCKLSGMTCPKGCCAHCIKSGDPALLTDKNGSMYVLASKEKMVTLMTPDRLAMAGGAVTVKGVLVKQGGVQAIFVDSMKKAK